MSDASKHINPEPEASSFRLIFTLGVAGFLSGLILVGTYLFTQPMIEANKEQALQAAIFQVLPGATQYRTLEARDGQLQEVRVEPQVGDEEGPRIFAGFNETGQFLGFAIPAEEPGYQDIISGIFGYDPERQEIVGFQVLESKETPGLGDKIIKDAAFLSNFEALAIQPKIIAVKNGEKTEPHQVEAITGATISSKAIVRLLHNGLDDWLPLMERYSADNQQPENYE
jgi:electron transport complex protein RnfG